MKPTAMLRDALVDLTDRDEIVLEPFAGSGSTLIACQQAGRVCHCIELDPLYIDVILKRYEAVAGQAATLEETNETYDELTRRRRGGVWPCR